MKRFEGGDLYRGAYRKFMCDFKMVIVRKSGIVCMIFTATTHMICMQVVDIIVHTNKPLNMA